MDWGPQPFRYSRDKYLLASAMLVIFRDSLSYSNFLPVRRATEYKLTASEMGPAFKKLEGDCGPPRTAAIHWRTPGEAPTCRSCCGTDAGAAGCLRILLSGMSRGSSARKPASIFPLLPTNIMPSIGSSLLSISNSGGVGGRIPPSYHIRSTAGLLPLAGYLKRTVQAVGKEKSLFTFSAVPSLNSQV